MAIDDLSAGQPEKVDVIEKSNEAVVAFTKSLNTHGNTKVELTIKPGKWENGPWHQEMKI